jgi:hypothetical protein
MSGERNESQQDIDYTPFNLIGLTVKGGSANPGSAIEHESFENQGWVPGSAVNSNPGQVRDTSHAGQGFVGIRHVPDEDES